MLPHGPFAAAQAAFLHPDRRLVDELDQRLTQQQLGVVAHFYMDPELQGVLAQCRWPHIFVADSLAMGDAAVRMAEAGVRGLVVLGVDFMAENARALLDAAGYAALPVYRVSSSAIGCSLAEAADSADYDAFLDEARQTPYSLHVVYINTSLLAKAKAQQKLPTITCTSSNVLATVLQAFVQIPEVSLFFGPDTYMGHNLQRMLQHLLQLDDAALRNLHPGLERSMLESGLRRFRYFRQGSCIVHHMFGRGVVDKVRQHYADAYITAHYEVPGEMFEVALEAQQKQRGVVGSTSQILEFISTVVASHCQAPLEPAANAELATTPLRFVLGTEASMITPIVRQVQSVLRQAGRPTRPVEIVFPVAEQAIAIGADSELPVLPGIASGEGCSAAGGCATCPYMRMNSLRALFSLLEQEARGSRRLSDFFPKAYGGDGDGGGGSPSGTTVAAIGTLPILAMRHLQRTGVLPSALVQRVRALSA